MSFLVPFISWSSKKQQTVSPSNSEADYKAFTAFELLHDFGVFCSNPCLLYCDNISATYMAANPVFHARTRHIEVRYHFVRDLVTSGHLQIKFVPSQHQLADVITKGLPAETSEIFYPNSRHPEQSLRGAIRRNINLLCQLGLCFVRSQFVILATIYTSEYFLYPYWD